MIVRSSLRRLPRLSLPLSLRLPLPLSLLVLYAALGGCATIAEAPSSVAVAAYRDSISLDGRIAVNYQKNGAPESITAPFTWRQGPERIEVSLFSPTGQTMARISITPSTATLTQTDGVPRTAADIDALTRQTLGWSLPVSGLREWLQGYAIGADGTRFVASPAANEVITRDGWHLQFVSWQAAPAGQGADSHPQPRRIDATRSATATTDELAIRIVLDPQA
jgi:outer membrane lipoprotein LolB